jgi:hypothetical protein
MATTESLYIPPLPPIAFVESFSKAVQDFENAGVRAGRATWENVFFRGEDEDFTRDLAKLVREQGTIAYMYGFDKTQDLYSGIAGDITKYNSAVYRSFNMLRDSGELDRQVNNIIGRTLDVYNSTGGDRSATKQKLEAMMSNIAKDGARESVVLMARAEAELRALDIAKRMGFEGSEEKAIETYLPQVKLRWQRVANPDACAFCALVARDNYGQIRTSANLPHYHDFCRCVAVPLWNGASPYKPAWYDDLEKKYGLDDILGRGYSSEEVLRLMRESARDKLSAVENILSGYSAAERSKFLSWDSLSEGAMEGILAYQSSGYRILQGILRSESWEEVFELAKSFRGALVTDGDLTDAIRRQLEYINNATNGIYGAKPTVGNTWSYRFENGDYLRAILGNDPSSWVGQNLYRPDFLSTSAWGDAKDFSPISTSGNKDIVWQIFMPNGTQAVGLNPLGAENEILLPPGTTLRIVNVDTNPNLSNYQFLTDPKKTVIQAIVVEQEKPSLIESLFRQGFLVG